MNLHSLKKHQRVLGLIALVGLTIGSGSLGATPQSSFQFAGEEFYYSIRLNGAEAIRVGVRAGEVKYRKGVPYVPIAGTAQSTGLFDTVYPINDKAHTFVNPDSFRPLRSEKYFDENGETREYKVDFSHNAFRAKVEKNKDDRSRKFSMAIPGTTHDMISWFYELRTMENFDTGTDVSFYVYDGWKLSHIHGKVTGKEDVLTPMGWFKAWKIDMTRDVMNSRSQRNQTPTLRIRDKDQSKATVWVSRDANRLPIKIAIDTPLGQGEAVLIKLKLASKN
jgi:hypothetical protein